MLFSEMAYLVDQIDQQKKRRGYTAAGMLAREWLGFILRCEVGELERKKRRGVEWGVLPGEDPAWNHEWTEAFAVKVAEVRFRSEKVVHWKGRR
jgi:hypothetical protein